jgi:hypothetical protein
MNLVNAFKVDDVLGCLGSLQDPSGSANANFFIMGAAGSFGEGCLARRLSPKTSVIKRNATACLILFVANVQMMMIRTWVVGTSKGYRFLCGHQNWISELVPYEVS